MHRYLARGAVASLAIGLAFSLAPLARAAVTVDSHGIRHETVTVGPVQVPETVSGRAGTGTYFYTYSYINARDAINAMLETAHMSTSVAVEQSDVSNLVADVKNGATTLAALSSMILGPDGVGDSSLPAGFHGHDPSVWHDMGFYSDDWNARCSSAEHAMGGGYAGGNNLTAAEAYVQADVDNGSLPTWNSDNLVNSHGGVDWYVWDWSKSGSEDSFLKSFNFGPFAPHLVGVFVPSPGQPPYVYEHESDQHVYNGPDLACTYIASSFFLSQTQRWLDTQSELANLGAGNLSSQAFSFARDDAGILSDFGDPLVLDLNHDHIIDVTGRSSAIVRARRNMPFVRAGSVRFDMYGSGDQRMEWIRKGDGFLVDARRVKEAIAAGRPFNGRDLMGDAEGMPGGFNKLATYDHQKAGKIVGPDLDRLMVWVNKADDGQYHPGELYTLKQLGITEIDYRPHFVYDQAHEPLEQASFVQHGKRYTVQEVWFAFQPKHLAYKPRR